MLYLYHTSHLRVAWRNHGVQSLRCRTLVLYIGLHSVRDQNWLALRQIGIRYGKISAPMNEALQESVFTLNLAFKCCLGYI